MFERTLKLIEKNTLEEIQKKKILLVGVGGVGGYALEALVRIGFQSITLIDTDTIEETNLNRQIISTKENIGCSKVEEAKNRDHRKLGRELGIFKRRKHRRYL